MEIVDFTVKGKGRATILPFGCVHWGHPNMDMRLFERFCAEAEATPNAAIIGMGDYQDYARSTYRAYLNGYVADNSSRQALDQFARADVEVFAKHLRPFAKKIAGLVEGNHYIDFMDGTTSTQYLCQILGVPYLGVSAFVRLHIQRQRNRGATTQLILVNHGYGSGGRQVGSDLAQMERNQLPGFDADIYLSSHTHKRSAAIVPILSVNRTGAPCLVQRDRIVAKTGAFLVPYCKGRNSYAEQKMYTPTSLGWIKIFSDEAHLRRRESRLREERLSFEMAA